MLLSARTKGANASLASTRLFAIADTPEQLAVLPVDEIAERIRPAGIANQKAKAIQALSKVLIHEHAGQVPDTREGLTALPGIGRKSADIVLRFVYRQPVVAVDTHVYRSTRRLGLAQANTADKVADELEANIPERWKMNAHLWFYNLGRLICFPRRPKCAACSLNEVCERNGVIL